MSQPKYRVLVVDDEIALRLLLVREFTRIDCECDGAQNGLQAMDLIRSRHYDAVVTDLRMPERNGHWLATELLKLPSRPVVVILTGVTEPKLAKDLIAHGVDDIVFKPIDQGTLAAKVRSLIARRDALASADNLA